MIKPPTPDDERARIDALRAMKVLDTPPEERFDRLTRLARRLFNVPIALVSLVDTNRQWFKSCTGLDASETPRDVSFCGHAILGDDIFLIADAAEDPRFSDNPLVVGAPHIRFYAGCPLSAGGGEKLGTLCIIDHEPRRLSQEELGLLQDLARMAEQELAAVQMATMDHLTMLSNRRGFEFLSAHALRLCRRMQRPASLLYFDLDDFKPINDRFGHTEGDRVLVDFAAVLKCTFRESDVIGRLGGDEFAVLVTNTDVNALDGALARFASGIERINREDGRPYAIAYSTGKAVFDPARHDDMSDLVAEADASMYSHKKCRRTHPLQPAGDEVSAVAC